jgi:hypothetical protein
MYFGDHAPPHFHVLTRADEQVKVAIETLVVLDGEADPRDTAEAFEWAASNREELRARWRQYSEEEP